MSKKPRDNRPHLPHVNRIELQEGNTKLRWILIVVLLAIGAVSIGYGLSDALNPELGWNEISSISNQVNCSSEFKFVYDFSEYGSSAGAVEKDITQLYSRACEKAYIVFSPDVEGQGNVFTLNAGVNEAVTIDPVLYDALRVLTQYNNRCVFLAPAYAAYNQVFLSESDVEAADYDPKYNPESKAYIQELMTYLSDPGHIRLELMDENTAKLVVSQEYLSFAKENDFDVFLDFGWMKNAFVADFLAKSLEEEGYTHGYLASYDGFTRNLDNRETEYSFNVFDRQGSTLYLPARLSYTGRQSIVFLRDYPMDDLDRWRYYVYQNGDICSAMLNPETGLSAGSVPTLISMAKNMSCADLLMQMLPAYLTEAFSEDEVNAMKKDGITSVWCEDCIVWYNDASSAPELTDTGVKEGYEIKLVD